MIRSWLVLLLSLWLAGVARADVAEARKHYQRGTRAFNLQDFAAALDEFKRAYVEQPDPVFLFNIAQAQRQLGAYDAAARSYRLFLANQPDAPNRTQVERLIEEMDRAAAEAHAKSPPTGTQPPAGLAGRESPSPPSPVRVVDTGKPMRLAGILTADAGIGLVALGVVFAILSKQAGDAAYHPSSGVYDHAADQRQANYRNADLACFVVGGAAMVVGTTIWLIGRKRRTTAQAAIAPAVSGGGVGVSF